MTIFSKGFQTSEMTAVNLNSHAVEIRYGRAPVITRRRYRIYAIGLEILVWRNFFLNFDFKTRCENELKDINEKLCNWSILKTFGLTIQIRKRGS